MVCHHSILQEREAWQKKDHLEEEEGGPWFQAGWDLAAVVVFVVAEPVAAAVVVVAVQPNHIEEVACWLLA